MSAKKSRIFYGWFIVAALIAIWTCIAGIAHTSFTSYIEPITTLFGWTYTQITFAASLRAVVLMILVPVGGLLSDRWGARKLIFAGITIVCLAFFLLSRINSLSQFYLCFILIGIGYSTSTSAIPQAIVGRWFRKKMSLATGILMVAGGFAGLIVPLVTRIIDIYGWQPAMAVFGISFWILLAPLSLIIRHSPEPYGYLPDGETAEDATDRESISRVSDTNRKTGIRQFLKDRVFWHITAAYALHIMAGSALTVHSMPYLSTISMDRTLSSFVAGALSIVGVFGRLGFGFLGDRVNQRWLAGSGTTMVSLSLIILSVITASSTWMIVPAVILFGVGYGGTITMHSVLIRENFGTINLGSVIGFSVGITSIGLMVGPPLASWLYESFDSYRITWLVFTGITIISIISQLTNPSVHTRKQKAGSATGNI
jgi:MFS family permease